jgi:crossover junction endodeoxyribonuclease RuvC
MKILGIDPGMAIVGYGMIEVDNNNIELITSGSIQTDKKLDDSKRLLEIYNDLSQIVEKYKPDCASVEQLFFFKNQKTIIPVAEARGVILTVLEKYGISAFSYTPMEVKQVLTGYGRAEKKEVEQMVRLALSDIKLPKLDDTVDAIAIAICHSRNCNLN